VCFFNELELILKQKDDLLLMFFWSKKKEKHKKKKKNLNELNNKGEQLVITKKEKTKNERQLKVEEQSIEVAAHMTDTFRLVPSNYQHVGARERQEDAFAFTDLGDGEFVDNKGVLAVVADGMGGLAKGDRASQTAVSIFLRDYKEKDEDDPPDHFLRRTVHRSNCAVFDLAFEGDKESELGTTLVAAAFYKGKMHWVSVGDSRIYLYRDNKLKQLNLEHIYANKLQGDVESGLITQKEAQEHPERSYLTSYLGLPELTEIDHSYEPLSLNAGEVIILCSDGLNNTLSDMEISETIKQSSGNIAEDLVDKALSKNKRFQDNITVLALLCKPIEPNGEKESN
jgi:PPM family protein phosphatase